MWSEEQRFPSWYAYIPVMDKPLNFEQKNASSHVITMCIFSDFPDKVPVGRWGCSCRSICQCQLIVR